MDKLPKEARRQFMNPAIKMTLVDEKETKLLYDFLDANPIYCAVALTLTTYIWPDIKSAYNGIDNPYDYYQRNRTPLMSDIIGSYRVSKQEYMVQAMAIYYYCREKDDYYMLLKLFKKAYKKVFKLVSSSEIILDADVDSFIADNYRITERNDRFIFSMELVAYYMCRFLNKNFYAISAELREWAEYMVTVVEVTVKDQGTRSSNYHKQKRIMAEYVKENCHINTDFNTIDMIMADYRHHLLEQKYPKHIIENEYYNLVKLAHCEDKLLDTYQFLLAILKLEGLNEVEFSCQEVPKEDVEELICDILQFTTRSDAANLPPELISEENMPLIPIGLMFKFLAREYKQASQLHLKQGIEETYAQVKTLEESMASKYKALADQEEAYKISVATMQTKTATRINALETHNTQLEKQVQVLQKQLAEQEKNNLELGALREYAYKNSEDTEQDHTGDYKHMTTVLAERHITIIGGNPKWRQRVEEAIPKCQILPFETLNKNWNVIKKLDTVYLNISYFNHPTYYKLMTKLREYGVTVHYISGHSNMNRTIAELYDYEI